jgi:L-glyceraldehyde 3-phosphate reductase
MSYEPNPKRYDGTHFRPSGQSGIVLPPISLGLWQNFGGVNVFEPGKGIVRRAFDRRMYSLRRDSRILLCWSV